MSTQVEAMIEECGLDPFDSEELAAFLRMVASMVEGAPVPSPALARLLSRGAVGTATVSLTVPRHQNALAAAALALSGIVVTGVAAAANDLPPTAQRLVAEFSQRLLPFDFPFLERRAEDLPGQTDHTFGESNDADRTGGTGQGVDDGEASTYELDGGPGHSPSVVDTSDGREADDDNGASPESHGDGDESGTETNTGEGDDPDDSGSDDSGSGDSGSGDSGSGDSGSGDSGESSSGENEGQDTASGDDSSDAEEFDGDSADSSGESVGDDPEYQDGTTDSPEAIDD